MKLENIRDMLADVLNSTVYMAKLPDTAGNNSICVYTSKHTHTYRQCIGNTKAHDYYYITILLHGNQSPRQTESWARQIFDTVRCIKDYQTQDGTVKFTLPTYDLQDVGTDESGIYEQVIETAVIYQ